MKTKYQIMISLLLASAVNVTFAPELRADSYPDQHTAIIGGKTWDLRPMGLYQRAIGHLIPDGDLKDTFVKLDAFLINHLSQTIPGFENEGFEELLVNPKPGEIQLVSQLPAGCIFIPAENLPPGAPVINVGCTKGNISYLLPEYFSKMDVIQRALLLIHEKLHVVAPDQAFEIKTDIVKAIYILLTRVMPAAEIDDPAFNLTDDELAILNRFSQRLRQIRPVPVSAPAYTSPSDNWKLTFTRNGGATFAAEGVQLVADFTQFYFGPGGLISGEDGLYAENRPTPGIIEVKGSKIRVVNSYLNAVLISGTDISIVNSRVLANKVEGNQIAVLCSSFQGTELTGNQISLNHCTITGSINADHLSCTNSTVSVFKPYSPESYGALYTQYGTLSGTNLEFTSSQFAAIVSAPIDHLKIESSTLGDEYQEAVNISGLSDFEILLSNFYGGSLSGTAIRIDHSELKSVDVVGKAILVSTSSVSASKLGADSVNIERTMISESTIRGSEISISDSSITGSIEGMKNLTIRSSNLMANLHPASKGGTAENILLDAVCMKITLPSNDPGRYWYIDAGYVLNSGLSIANIKVLDFYALTETSTVELGGPLQPLSLKGLGQSFWVTKPLIASQADLDSFVTHPSIIGKPI